MRFGTLDISAPLILGGDYSEAEIFGSAAWLWMHSKAHRDAPLHTLSALLLPALQHQQFVLAAENGKPVFYLSWACFDEEAESRYLRNASIEMKSSDWNSGDRSWILDWVAPFGHSFAMSRLLARQVFPNQCFRSLHHRGDGQGMRAITFRGAKVTSEAAKAWFDARPLSPATVMQTPHRQIELPGTK